MQRIWKIVGIATLVVVLGLAAVGAVAFAQDENGDDWPFKFRGQFHEAIAKALDISVEEYDAAVELARDQVLDDAVKEGQITEDQANRMRERAEQGPEAWGRGKGSRVPFMDKGSLGPRGGSVGAAGISLFGVAAEQLDMTPQELLAALQDGKSINNLAQEKGTDPADITAAILEKLDETLDQAVQDGKITQERATAILDKGKDQVPAFLGKTLEGRMPEGRKPEGHVPGGLPRGGRPGFATGHAAGSLFGIAAEKLDMTVQELLAELQDGKSMADVASEKGVNQDDIAAAYLEQLEESLNQAVDNGRITKEQATSMLEQAKEHVPDMLDHTMEGGMRGRWPGRFPGGERQPFQGQSDA